MSIKSLVITVLTVILMVLAYKLTGSRDVAFITGVAVTVIRFAITFVPAKEVEKAE